VRRRRSERGSAFAGWRLLISANQGEGYDGFAVGWDFFEELLLAVVGNGHFAGGNFCFSCADKAQFAVAQGSGIRGVGFHADGRAKDAAGHGTPFVDIAETGGGIEGGTWRLVGVVFEAGAFGIGFAEESGLGITGECGAVLTEPFRSTAFQVDGEDWTFDLESFHSFGEASSIKLIDGEGTVAASRAARAADEPWTCAACGAG